MTIEYLWDRDDGTIPPYETGVIYTHSPVPPAPGFELVNSFERADPLFSPSTFYKWRKRDAVPQQEAA